MVNNEILSDLFQAFPLAIINRCLEFVADPNTRINSYFTLENCETRTDVTCKLLEWLSREAYKSEHYHREKDNVRVHEYHRNGINLFCKTKFTADDMKLIYCKLGNAVDNDLTLEFIESGFDMSMLKGEVQNERLARLL